MTMRVRLTLLMVGLAMMGLASCDHYVCGTGAEFGASSCTGTTSTGTGSATALVYAVDTAGTLDSYTLNATAATLAATPSYTPPTVPASDGGKGMVVAQGTYLYVGYGDTEQLYAYTIGSTGTLTAVTGSPYSAPFMGNVGGGFGTESMITNPAGTLLFIADLLDEEVWVFQIGTGGALTAATGSPFFVGFGAVNMATDGAGNYLYVTASLSNHTGTEIGAYQIGTGGALMAVTGSPFQYPMFQVAGEPSGKFLIGTTGRNLEINTEDDDNLYVFNITQSSGTTPGSLSAPVAYPTTYSPFSIATQSNTGGNLVYSFSINDTDTAFNSVEGYSIDSSTGALTAVTGSPFASTTAALGSWGQFDQTGAYLFVYSNVDDAGTFTYSLGVNDVASGGALTEPIPAATLATSGFWVATDAP